MPLLQIWKDVEGKYEKEYWFPSQVMILMAPQEGWQPGFKVLRKLQNRRMTTV